MNVDGVEVPMATERQKRAAREREREREREDWRRGAK